MVARKNNSVYNHSLKNLLQKKLLQIKNCSESVNDNFVWYRYNEECMLSENNKINFAKTKKHEVVDEMCEVFK